MKRIGILVMLVFLSLPLSAQKQYRNTIYQFDYDSTQWALSGLALDVVIPGKSYITLLDTISPRIKVIFIQSEKKTTDLETFATTQMNSHATIKNFTDKWKPSPIEFTLGGRRMMHSSMLKNDEAVLMAWFFEEGDVQISVVEVIYGSPQGVSFSDAVNLIKSLHSVEQ